MKRAHIERQRTLQIWRQHLKQHDRNNIMCKCEFEVGRFRKSQRIGGCGQTRCYLCHGDKLMNRPKLGQRRSDISFNEWLSDYPPNVKDKSCERIEPRLLVVGRARRIGAEPL